MVDIVVKHFYGVPSDNVAQYCADELNRQEVTHEFMLNPSLGLGMFDDFYFWRGDDWQEMGMDPWQIVDDFDYYAKPDTRVFVERKILIAVLRTLMTDLGKKIDKLDETERGSKNQITALKLYYQLTTTYDEMRILSANHKRGNWRKRLTQE